MCIILLVLRKINLRIKIKHRTKGEADKVFGLLLVGLKSATTINF